MRLRFFPTTPLRGPLLRIRGVWQEHRGGYGECLAWVELRPAVTQLEPQTKKAALVRRPFVYQINDLKVS
jgi:hypothetical protein